jgi:hypothetical protein
MKKHKQIVKNEDNTTKNIIILILISIFVKIGVFLMTPGVFHSIIDTFDHNFYFDTIIIPYITNGSLPFINYNIDYPILMVVPVFIAAIPAIMFMNKSLFFTVFPLLMIICDIITTICIYYITLKIYNNPHRAFLASAIFATAFSTAYFVITKYDAFPTCLMMIGILFTVYGTSKFKSYGYISNILGFLTKLYPAMILPFTIFYNSKSTSLKSEIISLLKLFTPIALIIGIPLIILNPSAITTYFIQTGSRASGDIYVNSFTYTIYSWIHGILGINIQFDLISTFMYIIMGLVLISLFYLSFIYPEKNPTLLLELSLCALFAIIVFTRFHSPQYMMWFTPILCILVSGDVMKMGLFYLYQILAFIEFPLAWGYIYTNIAYAKELPSPGGQVALVFFTIEYIVIFYLVWKCIDHSLIPHIKKTIKFLSTKDEYPHKYDI